MGSGPEKGGLERGKEKEKDKKLVFKMALKIDI